MENTLTDMENNYGMLIYGSIIMAVTVAFLSKLTVFFPFKFYVLEFLGEVTYTQIRYV